MRVGVIGAGAVGGAIATLLAGAGHEVEVTARGAQLAAIRADGIRLSGAWGEHLARPSAAERLSGRHELVLLAVKAQDAAGALRENAEALGGVPLVVVQNGLDGIATARRFAPHSPVIGALALFASSYLSPGEITITAAGHSYLGYGDARPTAAADRKAGLMAARLLGTVMPVTILPNFVGAQWTKLVINQVNAIPAITGLSAQEVITHAALRHILTAGMREAVRIGLLSGVRFEALQGLSALRLRLFAAAPLALGQLLPLAIARRMGPTPNPGSTLQSIRRGQATEIDHLSGAVVRAAAAIGAPAPVTTKLVALVHEVERTGLFVRPDQLVARLA